MKIKPICLIGLMICLLNFKLSAQLNSSVFEEFTMIRSNSFLINPATKDTNYTIKLRANHHQNLGLFQNVTKFYVDADYQIENNKSTDRHWIGLQVTNSKYGDFINKSRAALRYSWYTPVSEKLSFSAGVSMGFVNYAFFTSQGTGGGSDFGLDGSLGFRLLGVKRQFGISSQQIFKSFVTPLNQSYQLSQLYNFDLYRTIDVHPNWSIKTLAIAQLSSRLYCWSYGADVFYEDNYSVGYTFHSSNRSSFQASVLNINIDQYALSIQTVYTLYHRDFAINNSGFELFLAVSK